MNILKPLVFVLLVSVVGRAHAELGQVGEVHLDHATVMSLERPPFGSGIVTAWAVLTVSTPNQDLVDLYILYLGDEQEFPEVGSICSIRAHGEYLEGIGPSGNVDESMSLLAPYMMACEGQVYDIPK